MKVVAIVQARMNSVRFPNKVMKKINNVPIIEILLKRLNKSKLTILENRLKLDQLYNFWSIIIFNLIRKYYND